MSSALPQDPRVANQTANALGSGVTQRGLAGMSPRQMELHRRYSYFRGTCYDDRKTDWNGDPIPEPNDTTGVSRSREIPPGHEDIYGNTQPLRARRPSAPYYLCRVVVKRFTGLLFSHRKHPKVRIEGDPITEDWLGAAIEAGRLWAQMITARDLGGSMGSVAVGFEVSDGTPLFEVFDARFCTPKFKNRLTHELESIEQRWTYTDWVQDEAGKWYEAVLWSRRVIDAQNDTLWQGVLSLDGSEPDWNEIEASGEPKPEVAEHGFGFVPVEWIPNVEVPGEVDGDPDCHGAFNLFEEIDKLTAQANKGITANCDPTLVVETDDELTSIEKGSEKFIRVNKGEAAQYLEINGAGCKLAMDQSDRLEDKALKLVQCVIDQARSAVSKTATEVDRDYSAMYEKGDVLREQYGERGVKRLLGKLLKAAKIMEDRGEPIVLPPRAVPLPNGKKKLVARKLGDGSGVMSMQWPSYTTPSVNDVATAVRAANDAKNGGLADDEHAAQFIATAFQVEDVPAMLAAIAKKQADADAAFVQQTTGGATGGDSDKATTFFQYEMDAGIVTINEMRGAKGLPPLVEDGDLTIPQYRAKYAAVFARSTMATNEAGAEKVLGMADAAPPTGAPPPRQLNGASH